MKDTDTDEQESEPRLVLYDVATWEQVYPKPARDGEPAPGAEGEGGS